jgi:hypothetical protein
VIEFEVKEAINKPNKYKDAPPVLHCLEIYLRRVTGGGRSYGYYSDEECANKIQTNMLVAINGKLLIESGNLGNFGNNGVVKVFLDVLPQEGGTGGVLPGVVLCTTCC